MALIAYPAALAVDAAVGVISGVLLGSNKKYDSGPFGGELYFNNGNKYIPVQRCYTFPETARAPANSAKWKKFPNAVGQVAFFGDVDCNGTCLKVPNSEHATVDFEGKVLDHRKASFVMVRIYKSKGSYTSAKQRSMLRATSNTSEVDSTEYYPAYVNSS